MPRKRHISPGFFTNPELYEAEALSGLPLRVAYAGLWCVADRRGRFEWKPRVLKLDILPFDAVDFEAVLSALKDHGFIRCYRVSGKLYGDIPTFLEHQHPHPKEHDSVIPAYTTEAQHVGDACIKHDSDIGQVPTYLPVGVSGPSEIQDLRSSSAQNGAEQPGGEVPAWSHRAVVLATARALPYQPGRYLRVLKPFVVRDGADVALGHWQVFLESGRHFDERGEYLDPQGPTTLLRPERFRDSYDEWKPSTRGMS